MALPWPALARRKPREDGVLAVVHRELRDLKPVLEKESKEKDIRKRPITSHVLLLQKIKAAKEWNDITASFERLLRSHNGNHDALYEHISYMCSDLIEGLYFTVFPRQVRQHFIVFQTPFHGMGRGTGMTLKAAEVFFQFQSPGKTHLVEIARHYDGRPDDQDELVGFIHGLDQHFVNLFDSVDPVLYTPTPDMCGIMVKYGTPITAPNVESAILKSTPEVLRFVLANADPDILDRGLRVWRSDWLARVVRQSVTPAEVRQLAEIPYLQELSTPRFIEELRTARIGVTPEALESLNAKLAVFEGILV